jgi:hypothetical protein
MFSGRVVRDAGLSREAGWSGNYLTHLTVLRHSQTHCQETILKTLSNTMSRDNIRGIDDVCRSG